MPARGKKKKKVSISQSTPLERVQKQAREKTLVIDSYLHAKVSSDNKSKVNARLMDFHGRAIESNLRLNCKSIVRWRSRQNLFAHIVRAKVIPMDQVNEIGALIVSYLPSQQQHVVPIAELGGVRFSYEPRPIPEKMHESVRPPLPLKASLSLFRNGEFLYCVDLHTSMYVERVKGDWFINGNVLSLVYTHTQQYQDVDPESTRRKQQFWLEMSEYVFHDFHVVRSKLDGVPVLRNGQPGHQKHSGLGGSGEPGLYHYQFDGPYRWAKINVPVQTNMEERASWEAAPDERFKPPDHVRIPFRTAISTRGETLHFQYAQKLELDSHMQLMPPQLPKERVVPTRTMKKSRKKSRKKKK
jgi:hypothetical protein